jgi:hypothetical protein
MTAHSTAKGIASLGRHGDDVIVHMSRDEVKGLQAIAQQNGTSLTINPHTGMPEAFKLGRLLGSVAPMALGWALGPGGFGLTSKIFGPSSFLSGSLGTGLLVGGATAALTGNLGKGLMAGFGAYGGSELGSVWDKMGGLSGAGVAGKSTADLNAQKLLSEGIQTTGADFSGPLATANPIGARVAENINNIGASITPAPNYGAGISTLGGGKVGIPLSEVVKPSTVGVNLSGNLSNANKILGVADTPGIVERFTNAGGTLGTLAGPAMTVASGAGVFDPQTYSAMGAGTRMKRVPTGTYDAQGNPEYKEVPAESYAPTETLNLNTPYANYPYVKQVPDLKLYAIGGAVDNNASSSAGISDLYNRPEGQTMENLSQDGYGIGRLNNLANAEAMNMAKVTGYANGGEISNYKDDQAALNLDGIKALNVGSLSNPDYYSPAELRAQFANAKGLLPRVISMGWDTFRNPEGLTLAEQYAKNPLPRSSGVQYAKGGYLDGPGDGMSDSIPATINNAQPARLADGEFVVSADVVSHLGNGSTKAGAKKLYKMMDKVRLARTGTKKQGKQINADKYLPRTA